MKTSTLAFLLLTTSLIVRLSLSNSTLDFFIPYVSEGGNSVYKIHPGTYLALIGFAILATLLNTSKVISIFRKPEAKRLRNCIIATTVVIVYGVIRFGSSGAAHLIDTFLYTLLILYFALFINDRHRTHLLTILLAFLVINSLISIYEYSLSTTLLPNPTYFSFFRANGIFGHPLNNGLIMFSLGMTSLLAPIGRAEKITLWMLCLISFFTFGSRGALLAYLTCSLLVLIIPSYGGGSRHLLMPLRIVSGIFIALGAGALALFIIFNTSLGESIASRFLFDDSAESRVESLAILGRISPYDYFWGVGSDGVSILTDNYINVPIIENFWIYTILQLGFLPTLLLFAPILSLARGYMRKLGAHGMIFMLGFIFAASTNNSLSTKTPALAVFLLCALIASKHSRLAPINSGRLRSVASQKLNEEAR